MCENSASASASASAMSITVNPSEFCNQFREALSADLRLSPRSCPRCVLHSPDLGMPDACHWEDGGGDLVLHCVYDFEAPSTTGCDGSHLASNSTGVGGFEAPSIPDKRDSVLKEARIIWITDVLKECYRVGGVDLYVKWLGIFNIDPTDEAYFPLRSVWRCRSTYEDYDTEEEAKLLALGEPKEKN